MSTQTLVPPPRLADDDDDLDHVYCCSPNLSLCGRDISMLGELPEDMSGVDCMVCVDLMDKPCDVCGEA